MIFNSNYSILNFYVLRYMFHMGFFLQNYSFQYSVFLTKNNPFFNKFKSQIISNKVYTFVLSFLGDSSSSSLYTSFNYPHSYMETIPSNVLIVLLRHTQNVSLKNRISSYWSTNSPSYFVSSFKFVQ